MVKASAIKTSNTFTYEYNTICSRLAIKTFSAVREQSKTYSINESYHNIVWPLALRGKEKKLK